MAIVVKKVGFFVPSQDETTEELDQTLNTCHNGAIATQEVTEKLIRLVKQLQQLELLSAE